jgi:hypothetical protein
LSIDLVLPIRVAKACFKLPLCCGKPGRVNSILVLKSDFRIKIEI